MDGVEFKTEPHQDLDFQVERILQSETLKSSASLRRLLRYIAQKTISGEADQLKEYTVAVEGLGKPESYDPRQESAVRIQVGRLRQKLADYYRSEGKDDPIVVDLPRGRFRLNFEVRSFEAQAPRTEMVRESQPPFGISRKYQIIFLVSFFVSIAWAVYSTIQLKIERDYSTVSHSSWTPAVSAFWQPFVSPSRPLTVVIQTWPFADVPGFGMFWNRGTSTWEEMMESPAAAAIRKLYPDASPQPYDLFTTTSTASGCFQVGKLLGSRVPSMSVVRFGEFSWQQAAHNNVIYLGNGTLFQDKLQSLPTELEFVETNGEIRILHPRPGESPSLSSSFARPVTTGNDHALAIRIAYALVTNVSGPENNGVIRAFTSPGPSARAGALTALSDPGVAPDLFAHLKDRSGHVPRNFQLLLRMKYADGVVTNTEYVTHRILVSKKSQVQ